MNYEYSCYIDRLSDPRFQISESPTIPVNDASFLVDPAFIGGWIDQNGLR
jgi:hypothetical protein